MRRQLGFLSCGGGIGRQLGFLSPFSEKVSHSQAGTWRRIRPGGNQGGCACKPESCKEREINREVSVEWESS